ncbi:MAG: Uma2 family endonuclease [Anaerolineae bacterium]|nr:Uma2 family endonuclease [Anaerolineae bacterium]
MSPMRPLHATVITLAARVLEQAFGAGYFVRWQMPLALDEYSEPEPDVIVVEGDIRDYVDDHPATAVLVAEVAESSLDYDQGEKASLYAAAGLADYWLFNLVQRRLEVRRDPVPNPQQSHGFAYQTTLYYQPGEVVSPLARPDLQIPVAAMFP